MSLPTVVGVAYRDDSTANVSDSQGTDCPLPAGVVDGDLLIYVIASYSQPWSVSPSDSGVWTRLAPYTYSGTQTFDIFATVYSSTLNLTFFSNDATLRRATPASIAIRGWSGNIGDLVIGTTGLRSTQGLDGYHTIAPGLVTTQDDCLVLSAFVERTTATTNEPSGAGVDIGALDLAFFATGTIESILFSHIDQPTAGSSGDVTATYPNVQANNGVAVQVAVPGGLPAPGVQAAYKTVGGAQVGTLYAMTGSGPAMVTEAHDVPGGYTTVSEMLSTSPFVVAHRGGSRSYPEMSLHAYTQSIVKDYGAIELSLARTSDGVWFGLHDATLDRTSGVSGVTAASITWTQVQTYNILGSNAVDNPTQPDRPYMRWEELIAAYYPSHVIFVDPKVAMSYRSELLAMMDALPGTPQDHLVAKYYGVEGGPSNTGWAKDAADHGYERWGYFYQPDAANFAAYQGRWSILGLSYYSDQPTWDALLSYGKPVIGHICPDMTSVNTALAMGASGLMVSGTASIDPLAI